MGTLIKDVRFSFRMLAASPGFTAVAVLVIALGIGANSAVFSLVNAYLLRPLPFPASDELVAMWQSHRERNLSGSVAYPVYLDWRAQQQVFSAMAAANTTSLNLTGDGEPERIIGRQVTWTYLRTFGVKPVLGRDFLPEDDRPGAPKVALLSYGIWQRRFGKRAGVVGSAVEINGEPNTVIGVLPPGMGLRWDDEAILVPLALDPAKFGRGNQFLAVFGRLKPGVPVERAQRDMRTIAERLPDRENGWSVTLQPLRDRLYRQAREGLTTIMVAVAFVLLIACVNVANLLLAKGASRRKEIAIRAALGAGRWRIVRQMLTESLILALAGAAAGLLFGLWASSVLASLFPQRMRPLTPVSIDGMVLVFTIAAAVLTGLLFGLAPAWKASRPDINETLKEGSRGSTGGHNRLRAALVVAEVSLAMVLLVGAGLSVKSFSRVLAVDPGFSTERLLTMTVMLPDLRYTNDAQRIAFFERTLERISALPGITGAAVINNLPLAMTNMNSTFHIEGRPEARNLNEAPIAGYRAISPGYLTTMRIPLIRGRQFTAQDRADAPLVALVNEAAARRYWGDQDPVGKRIRYGSNKNPWITIVGVVGNVRHFGLSTEFWPEVYRPQFQAPIAATNLVVRTAGDPLAAASAVRTAVREIDPKQPVADIRSMDEVLSDSTFVNRLMAVLLGSFAVLALLLAGVGLYGVISYAVTQRSHEIGIRVALGAARGHVLRMVVGHGMLLTGAGLAIGMAAAYALAQFLRTFLFGVPPRDPATFGAVAGLLAAVALAATTIPALRATRVNPIHALRHE